MIYRLQDIINLAVSTGGLALRSVPVGPDPKIGVAMDDRRQYTRKEMMLKVVCRSEDEPSSKFKAVSADISLGGIGLYLKTPIEKGKKLVLDICTSFWAEPIKAVGEVVWQAGCEKKDQYRVGIRFTDAPWSHLKELCA